MMKDNKLSKKEIIQCGKRLLELKELDVVKEYVDVLHKVVHYEQEKPTKEYYKSSKKYDYYILRPYEEFTILPNFEYGFRKHSYDAIGKAKDRNSTLYFCLSLCNFTKKEIMDRIDQHIQKDNEEVKE